MERIVVKIGTTELVNNGNGLDRRTIGSFARQVAILGKEQNIRVAIVSSGAIASGRVIEPSLGNSIVDKQAAAIFGQPDLIYAWKKAFRNHGVDVVGQALYRDEDLLNARYPLLRALEVGPVIINGNDAVYDQATEEVVISADNDRLARFVADEINSDMLVFFTGAGGVLDPLGRIIPQIRFDEDVKILQTDRTESGTEGIDIKLEQAKLFASSGKNAVILSSRVRNGLLRVVQGERLGTWVVYN